MTFRSLKTFRVYFLPGLVFQSILVGGGYGTGREVAEFYLPHGAIGGLLAICISTLVVGTVMAIAFEFARMTTSYDYRTFFRGLLGPLWRLVEITFMLFTILVLAVLASATGDMMAETFGFPPLFGILLLAVAIAALAFFGSSAIESALTVWSFVLYAAYFMLFIWAITAFGPRIMEQMGRAEIIGSWHLSGISYAAINLAAIAPVLFVLRHIETRREAIISGLIAGVIGLVPALFVFIALLSQYPAIIEAPVPVTTLLAALDRSWFGLIFQVILFGTFIETGVGVIHALNERFATSMAESRRRFPDWIRPLTAISVLMISIILANTIGIITLVNVGYRALAVAFICFVIIPILTIGLYRVLRKS